MAIILISLGLCGILIPFVFYPLTIGVLSQFKRSTVVYKTTELPTVDIFISAYNEGEVIEEKIRNTLKLDYPSELLNIYVISDGSTDNTDVIVNKYKEDNVRLIKIGRQSGKTYGQNIGVKESNGKILVFSDANAMYEPSAIKNLISHFYNPRVGVVCGELKFVHTKSGGENVDPEGQYWEFEKWLKKRESSIFSTLGANGSIYAVRRKAYCPLDPSVSSDFIEPLIAVSRGWKSVYEPKAISCEKPTYSTYHECQRKVRIVSGSVYSLLFYWSEIMTGNFPLAVMVICHKILRWLIPIWLIFIISGMIVLPGSALIFLTLIIGIFFYGILLFKGLIRDSSNVILNRIGYGSAMLISLAVGLIQYVRGNVYQVWNTARD